MGLSGAAVSAVSGVGGFGSAGAHEHGLAAIKQPRGVVVRQRQFFAGRVRRAGVGVGVGLGGGGTGVGVGVGGAGAGVAVGCGCGAGVTVANGGAEGVAPGWGVSSTGAPVDEAGVKVVWP